MASLREAIDAGFSNVELLRTDQDLENLRARPDFQKLLADTRQRMQEQMQAEVAGNWRRIGPSNSLSRCSISRARR